MNKLIYAPFMILLLMAIFSILIGIRQDFVDPITFPIGHSEITFDFAYDFNQFVGASLAGIIGGLVFIGIKIIGSGLNDQTVRILSGAVLFSTLWTMTSTFSSNIIKGIPIFGVIVWSVLSVVYVVGVIVELTEGGDVSDG